MVDQVNSGSASGSSSNVEMDTVLELLEKAVLLIGQCNNTIKYEEGKMCYWVSQRPPHHK